MRAAIPLLATGLLVTGCATTEMMSAQAGSMTSDSYPHREELAESLFPGDQAVLSNEAIETILSSKITLASDARIAVIRVRQPGYRWWSHELAKLDQDIIERLLNRLTACERVASAALLPSMLMPRRLTVPHVRAAAARYQADLVLLYQSSSYTYAKQRFLGADETKSHCIVEAVLLDTRTGIIPFSTIASETYGAKKERDDLSFNETMWKAEMTAVGRALDEIAGEVAAFLDQAP